MCDIELTATVPVHELTFTYKGRTWDLTAYALEDFGTWEAVAHEHGTDGPALPAAEWGVTKPIRDPWSGLSTLVEAIIRKAMEMNDAGQMPDLLPGIE